MTDGHLSLLQLNDTHAYLEPHLETFWEGGGPAFRTAGGYARIAGLVDSVREETDGKALLLDCGDTFHGTAPAVKTRGAAMVPVLNALGIGAMTGQSASTAFRRFQAGLEALRSILETPCEATRRPAAANEHSSEK